MNKKPSSIDPAKSETDWEQFDALADNEIDYSDIPPLTEEQLKAMRPLPQVLAEKGVAFESKPGPHLVTVTHEDGSQEQYFLEPQKNPVYLAPDVQAYFPDSEAVNNALRTLISLFPTERS
jgi:hypothetical protein